MNNPGEGPHYAGYNHSGVAVQWLPVQHDHSQIGTPCLPEIGDLLTSHVRRDDDRGNHLVGYSPKATVCASWLWKTTPHSLVFSVKAWRRNTTRSMWRPMANRPGRWPLKANTICSSSI